MSGGSNLEVEVKFLVEDLESMRQRLLQAGARQVKPRLYERNVRFDDSRQTLLRKGELLRLRQDDAARLTFKGVAGDDETSEAKVREELEITIGDFATATEILRRLGFDAQQVYEKYRETFYMDGVELVLDELPIGNFMELEGSEASIRAAAKRLDLSWNERILDNYLLLLWRVKKHYDLPFDDLTFANFEGLTVSVADVLHRG